uniref:adenylate kinase n=1 Tax=Musa acuminata subsp. malaccensis TaxID=214687 RepID=A0A804L5N4_MUSAM|nr:PREDICTED: probable adenylate kinase 7, mitochondrial isoform X2 [Musa acuminata subsp. malaccensis]
MAGICRLGTAATRSLARRMIAAPPHRRSFSAVALADYWTEWEDEEEDKERCRHAMTAAEACGEREPGGVQWVFMGSPAAQRHVYATRVAKLLDVPYISMGSLVRQELNPSSCLYNQIVNAMNGGRLVPQEIVFGLLSKRLEEGYQRGETGFILDGIPRTRIQAAFDAINSESTSLSPCLATRTRHDQLKSSAAVDMKDLRMEKFRLYSEQIQLLEEYYRKQKKLLDVQVTGGPAETWRGLLAALHLQHMDTATAQKLTV